MAGGEVREQGVQEEVSEGGEGEFGRGLRWCGGEGGTRDDVYKVMWILDFEFEQAY